MKLPIRVLVVDDEEPARANVRALLANDSEFVIVGEAGDGDQAIRAVRSRQPDVILLDIQMPGRGGFEVLDAVVDEAGPGVVFVTAYDRYAVRAFEAAVIDYVVKPYSGERLRTALERARHRIHREQLGPALRSLREQLHKASSLARLAVRDGEATVLIRVDRIDRIEAADYYARVHAEGRQYLIKRSLRSLEAELDPTHFVRVHRSDIVNLDRVVRVHPWRRGSFALMLDTGDRLILSRRRRAAFEAAVG